MNKYDVNLELNEENPLTLLLKNIRKNSTILEFGPATGRLTRYLQEEMGCKVYIVEIDEEGYNRAINYAVDGYLGDIEGYKWVDKFRNIQFDYILFADVLEHLRNPELAVKKSVELLKYDGMLGVSIPNIAHNSIIINLLRNTFQYNQIGLLDNTHIKLFTYYSAKAMLENADLVVCNEMANYLPAMANEFPYTIEDMSPIEKDTILNHEYGNVYQFVFMSVKKKYYEENNKKITLVKNIRNSKVSNILKLYVNTGNGDRDNESLINSFNFKSSTVSFNLKDYSEIKSLRCDFFAADKCIIKIKDILIDGVRNSAVNLVGNQVFSIDDMYIFDTNNPYVYILPLKNKIDTFSISFTLEKIYDFEIFGRCLQKVEQLNTQNEAKISSFQEKNNQLIEENKQLLEEKKESLESEVKFDSVIEEFSNKVDKLTKEKISLQQRLAYANDELNIITGSTYWRITKPVRIVLDFIKRVLKANHYTHMFYKTLIYLRDYGFKKTWNKIRFFLSSKPVKSVRNIDNKEMQDEVMNLSEIQHLEKLDRKIAVHAHLYYVDLIDEFIDYLNNIPYRFDLFVSCNKDTDIELVNKKLKRIKMVDNIETEITINRGRDIAPLYVQFGKKIEKYDYFLHIHTKKSLYSGNERYGWRQYSLDSLLGSTDIVKSIFALFETDKKVGVVCPEIYDDVPPIALDWLANAEQGRQILNRLRIKFENGIFTYPVGSFFWAKMDAVLPLFKYGFKYDDFEAESGQTDGTTAHALERIIAFVLRDRGYKMAIHEHRSGNVYFDNTLKPFRQYFSLDVKSVKNYLNQYDVISFDIFDTLITRCVYQPDDVFHLITRKIKKKYKIDIDFLTVRKKAEAIAWEKRREHCSINDIYAELPKVAKISKKMAMELKQMEISTELSVCIPRRDMLEIFNYVKSHGKKIVLISDMYLTSDIISEMLSKCGYYGYEDIWISCEKGARKDNCTIWASFFNQYGHHNTIHVGDNMRSDNQTLIDQGREAFLVLNPISAFKLTKNYSKFKKYIDTTVENSLMLGMLVNDGLHNSPFSQQVDTGEPFINEDKQLGYIGFGAIFTSFVKWIDRECKTNSKLLFLAREGYLLEKVYKLFYESIDKTPLKSVYFLSSRRAATVSAIQKEQDIEDIITQYYKGSLTNLLKSRLGIDLYQDMEECEISMPEDGYKVMNMIRPHIDDIYKKAKKEAELYLKYINEVIGESLDSNLAVVDVGYAGTIQYYLSKLLNMNISGYYICTGLNKKPEKLGCKCNAIYPLNTLEKVNSSKIFKGQLFLEAALQAPYGQLICFDEVNGKVIPQFKDDNNVPIQITNLQEGIMEYCRKYSTIIKDFVDDVEINKNLAEDIFYEILFNGSFPDNICSAFNVQDDYCSNGIQKFDAKNKKWSIV